MNPDADHQFCVPPALEDEIGTELKFAQRGERPSSFEMSSEPADLSVSVSYSGGGGRRERERKKKKKE